MQMEGIQSRNRIKRVNKFKDYSVNFIFAVIPLIGFCLFSLIPYIISIYLSFTELHNSQISNAVWIGFENYKNIFTTYREKVGYTFLTTLIFTLNVPIGIVISVWIAKLVNSVTLGKGIFRSLFFIPYVCAITVIVISFRFIFDQGSGILNSIFTQLGFKPLNWMTQSPLLFLTCAVIISVWSGLGYKIVLLMAALSKVDKSYYEAAAIDGARESTIFWKITLPAITPTIGFLLTMGLIGSFQDMTTIYVMCLTTVGIPWWGENVMQSWYSVSYFIYQMMFHDPMTYGYGMASALGWVLGIIIFVITRINMKLQDRWVSYDF